MPGAAQDPEFMKASPEEQHAYLAQTDPDYAAASPEEQQAYLGHLTGRKGAALPPPAAGAPPPVGTLPNKGDTGEGPIAQGLTTFETKLAEIPGGIKKLAASKYWPVIDSRNLGELGRDLKSLNPIATDEGSLPMNIGATAANLLPFGHGISDTIRMIPRAGRAGETLNAVAKVAGDVPADTSKIAPIIRRAVELKEHGAGTLPPPLRMFEKNYVRPNAPITFNEMRDFGSTSGRLSAKAQKAMSPLMKGQLKQFAGAVDEANRAAAESVGQGEKYAQGINEYRRAMKMRDFGKKAAGATAAAAIPYGGYRLYQMAKSRE